VYCKKVLRTKLDTEKRSNQPKKLKKKNRWRKGRTGDSASENGIPGGIVMTKKEVLKLLVLIESVYSNCILKDETVLQWFESCSEMDFDKVMAKLKHHIRKSPFPPAIADIAVNSYEEYDFPDTLQEWMKIGRERIEPEHNHTERIIIPAWLAEYSIRKTV
jgi:hypothetical protein